MRGARAFSVSPRSDLHSEFGILPSPRRSGFTIIELLVVMAIIIILISAVLVASTTLMERGRVNNTRAVLQVVADALEEFKREQQERPTLASARQQAGSGPPVRYKDRYGYYPPDELEVFTPSGLPGSTAASTAPKSLAPGHAEVVTSPPSTPPFSPMRFFTTGDPAVDALEFRDIAAMVVAMETVSEKAAMMLDRLPDRNRKAVPVDSKGDPAIFLDRRGAAGGRDGKWGPEDFQIRYIVDAWGNPLGYMAQRDWKAGDPPAATSNHASWNEASTKIVQANQSNPAVFSYGPDGEVQLTREVMGSTGAASLPGDYATDQTGSAPDSIDHPLNADNIYLDATLAERLANLGET